MSRPVWQGRLAAVLPIALFVALISGCGTEGGGDEVIVSAASSLEVPFTEYGETLDTEVSQQFAGSDELAAQIRNGAKPDVYASADVRYTDQLFEEGLVEKPVEIASNRLVLAVPADSDINFVTDLTEPGLKIVVGDDSVPVGVYTAEYLAKLPPDVADGIEANVRSREPEVSSVVGKLTQGAADAGFVYETDVIAAEGELKSIPIPDEVQPDIAYAAAVVKDSENPEGGQVFIEGLVDGEGATLLREAKFISPR